jgi:nitrite reductase/ring-hydroxylating ferredoxin subunit
MFEKVAGRGDVKEGEILGVDLGDGVQVALYDIAGDVYATTNICAHAYCLLSESGDVYDEIVECSCHGSSYDIRTGMNVNPPSSDPLRTFPVEVRGDEVHVDAGR